MIGVAAGSVHEETEEEPKGSAAKKRTAGWHEGHGWQPVALVVGANCGLLPFAAGLGADDDHAGLVVAGRGGGRGAGGGDGGEQDERDEGKLATHEKNLSEGCDWRCFTPKVGSRSVS